MMGSASASRSQASEDPRAALGAKDAEARTDAMAETTAAPRLEDVEAPASETIGAPRTEDFRKPGANVSDPPIMRMGTNQLTLVWSQELKREFGEDKHAAKKIARLADTNVRTAENWLYGHNTPDLLHALRLMAKVPGLAGEMRRLMAMESDLDPEFERDFHKLVETFTRARERDRR